MTGGAGFIGSHLCERLLKEGAEVIVLDNFCTGKPANLKSLKNSIKIITGDIIDARKVEAAVKGSDAIIHEAFPYGRSGMDLENLYAEEGVMGTFNILRSAVRHNVKKVVFASSVAVYGIQKYLPIDEKHPLEPFLPYGATKLAGELYCSTFSKLYGLDTISLRYFYIYGPRYSSFDHSAMVNFINRAIHKKPLLIYGDGSQVRDYTYIDDAIDGTILALKKDKAAGEVYNISSGRKISILDLAQRIKKVSGNDLEIRLAGNKEYKYVRNCPIPVGMTDKINGQWLDQRNYSADLNKAIKDLGFSPKVDLEAGIKKTMAWLNY